jgi:hypothetical protein
VDFLRKRLPAQVGRYLQGVEFSAPPLRPAKKRSSSPSRPADRRCRRGTRGPGRDLAGT